MKYLLPLLFIAFSYTTIAQCDSTDYVINGSFITNTISNPKIKLKPGSDIPKKGQILDFSKYVETEFFASKVTMWMRIAHARVISANETTVQIKVLEEQANVVKNGKKVNQFAKGNIVKAEWRGKAVVETVLEMEGSDTLLFGEKKCGKRQGVWKKYYPGNKLKLLITYVDGERSGAYKIYEKEGYLSETGTYKNDKIDGLVTVFDENGKTLKTLTYEGGSRNGISKYYEFDSNQVTTMETYKDGKVQGLLIDYYENGNEKFKRTYNENKKIDGIVYIYYENGNIKIERSIDNGVYTGYFKEFFESGQLHLDYTVKEKYFNKGYKSYFENGKLEKEGMYDDGRKEGTWKTYYENGNLQTEKNYNDNKLLGLSKSYTENGTLVESGEYAKGEIKIGHWLEFYPDGSPKSDGTYTAEGKKTGKWFTWDEKGKKSKEKF